MLLDQTIISYRPAAVYLPEKEINMNINPLHVKALSEDTETKKYQVLYNGMWILLNKKEYDECFKLCQKYSNMTYNQYIECSEKFKDVI